jgi:RNA polymerase sigma-70 factor (ECF subfamily)
MDAALRAKRGSDDLLQEAYVQIVRQISQFRGDDLGSFLNWAGTILDHKLIDARRAAHCQARDIGREVPAGVTAADSYWGLLDHLYAESGTPSRVVRRQEALSALLASLAEVSESHRQVIQLRFLEGLSVADVAARLGKSEAAVVALTKRALEALRQSMDRLGEFTHGV